MFFLRAHRIIKNNEKNSHFVKNDQCDLTGSNSYWFWHKSFLRLRSINYICFSTLEKTVYLFKAIKYCVKYTQHIVKTLPSMTNPFNVTHAIIQLIFGDFWKIILTRHIFRYCLKREYENVGKFEIFTELIVFNESFH